jgi:hypothetical protein
VAQRRRVIAGCDNIIMSLSFLGVTFLRTGNFESCLTKSTALMRASINKKDKKEALTIDHEEEHGIAT